MEMFAPSYSTGNSSDSSLRSSADLPSARPLSPFLNFDAKFLETSPEFIFPEDAASQRGRFELAFSQIGGSCIIGAGFGGAAGLYAGLKHSILAGYSSNLTRTQVINHVMKQGAASANTLGVLAVMYSGFGVILSWARGEDDEANTVIAATATGALFKSAAGMKRCVLGGAVGFGLAAAYHLWNSTERLKSVRGSLNMY